MDTEIYNNPFNYSFNKLSNFYIDIPNYDSYYYL